MILKKFIAQCIKLQFIRLLIFIFIAFLMHFVFKTRSITVFYAFALILTAIYVFTILKLIITIITFTLRTKNIDTKLLNLEFLNTKPYCQEFYLFNNYILIFKAGFSDINLNLIELKNIKSVSKEKMKKGDGEIINITIKNKEKKDKSVECILFSDDDKIKKEFDDFYREIKKR